MWRAVTTPARLWVFFWFLFGFLVAFATGHLTGTGAGGAALAAALAGFRATGAGRRAFFITSGHFITSFRLS